MSESKAYKSLAALTKARERWEENIPYVASLLPYESVKIQAKALWLLGEMGFAFPLSVQEHVPAVAAFLDSGEPNALGRIGRRCFQSVEPYWEGLFRFSHDAAPGVRLAFIWASENIATQAYACLRAAAHRCR